MPPETVNGFVAINPDESRSYSAPQPRPLGVLLIEVVVQFPIPVTELNQDIVSNSSDQIRFANGCGAGVGVGKSDGVGVGTAVAGSRKVFPADVEDTATASLGTALN